VKSIAVRGWASALVGSALAIGCVEEERVPIGYTIAPAVTATQPRPGVTSAQQQPPPAVDDVEAPPGGSVAAPPAESATESPPNGRARAVKVVGLASLQVDRLRRMERSAGDSAPREDVDAALSDLEINRGKVLQDLRELELRASEDVSAKLDGDVDYLQNAVRASYVIAPDASHGLPQPTPLPPSQAW